MAERVTLKQGLERWSHLAESLRGKPIPPRPIVKEARPRATAE